MNSTTIITGMTPVQARELVCNVYGADHLHVPGTTHRRSRATTLPTAWHQAAGAGLARQLITRTHRHTIHSSCLLST
jgi:hypothetical protein